MIDLFGEAVEEKVAQASLPGLSASPLDEARETAWTALQAFRRRPDDAVARRDAGEALRAFYRLRDWSGGMTLEEVVADAMARGGSDGLDPLVGDLFEGG